MMKVRTMMKVSEFGAEQEVSRTRLSSSQWCCWDYSPPTAEQPGDGEEGVSLNPNWFWNHECANQ